MSDDHDRLPGVLGRLRFIPRGTYWCDTGAHAGPLMASEERRDCSQLGRGEKTQRGSGRCQLVGTDAVRPGEGHPSRGTAPQP